MLSSFGSPYKSSTVSTGPNQQELLKYIVLLSTEIDRLKNSSNSFDSHHIRQNSYDNSFWKEKYEASERNYKSLEINYQEILAENSRLAEMVKTLTMDINHIKLNKNSDSDIIKKNEELQYDNKFLAQGCNTLKKEIEEYKLRIMSLENVKQESFVKEKQIYAEESLEINNNHIMKSQEIIELEALIVLLRAENDRLHELCEELNMKFNENLQNSQSFINKPIIQQRSTQMDSSIASELYLQFNDQINIHQELSLWKGRFYEIERNYVMLNTKYKEIYEKFGLFNNENERLNKLLIERNEEIKRLNFEWREAEKLAVLFPELNGQINRLLEENQRLKSVILNRCRDLSNNTWSF